MTTTKKTILMIAAAVVLIAALLVLMLRGCAVQPDETVSAAPSETARNTDEHDSETVPHAEADDTAAKDDEQIPVPMPTPKSAAVSQTVTRSNVISVKEDASAVIDIGGESVQWIQPPAYGEIIENGDGTFSYQPGRNYHGSDTLSYTCIGSDGTEVTVTVDITVDAVNDAPRAQDDVCETDEDMPLVISAQSLLQNDRDVDSRLRVVSTSAPESGSLADNSDGTYTYTPGADFNGTDSFSYTAGDGRRTDTATVTVTVNAVGDAPAAADDVFVTDEDTPVVIFGLLSNDTDADGDALSVTAVTDPVHGSLAAGGDGTYTYTPDANFNGADSFAYTASDGAADGTANVTVTIGAVNDAPAAVDDVFVTDENTPLVISGLLSNDTDVDGDTLSVTAVTDPAHGSLAAGGDGTYTYTPNADFYGTDSFAYTASDGAADDTATVTVTVNEVNTPPAAVDDAYMVNEKASVVITPLLNDTDLDGDTLSVISISAPANGVLTAGGDGTYTYTPNDGFHDVETMTYTVSDGAAEDTATVTVTVNGLPVTGDDIKTVSMSSGCYYSVNVLSNDSDPDGDTLTITRVWGYSLGRVINDGYRLRYKYDSMWLSPRDTVYYEVSDGNGGKATGKLTVKITY